MTADINFLTSFEVWTGKSTYPPGEPVVVNVQMECLRDCPVSLEIKLHSGLRLEERRIKNCSLVKGTNKLNFRFTLPEKVPAGYEVQVSVIESGSEHTSIEARTAFDVLNSWIDFPRYGFLSDFSPARKNPEQTIGILNHYHLNGLQFYDWQYRHDELVPPSKLFIDPLGREQSLDVAIGLVEAAHQYGMAAMPYLAIYAASAAFWKAHPEWALYDEKHQLIPFGENFLGIMNPVAGGGWSNHLLDECKKVLEVLPFDGLHIDQYGDPKVGYDTDGKPVDLPTAFADFVKAASGLANGKPVLFNAVGNWPIDRLAVSPVAFNYIEIWPPKTTYADVAEIVRNARVLSNQKPVVIALYLPANRPINNLLADAVIYSAGGTRIEVGENGRLLSDPYFPKHEEMPVVLGKRLRRQTEMMIRYCEWISPLIPEVKAKALSAPEGVMPFMRRCADGYSLSLVNLGAGDENHWNEEHGAPATLIDFGVEVEISQKVDAVWMISPDSQTNEPKQIPFVQTSSSLSFQVPSLNIWNVMLIVTH